MELDSLTYPEALKWIAEKANIAIEYEGGEFTKAELSKRDRLSETLRNVVAIYIRALEDGGYESPAMRELRDTRQLDDRSIGAWQLGYCDGKQELTQLLPNSLKELRELGLINENTGADIMGHSVIYPIHSRSGEVLAIAGRNLDYPANERPKWLNLANSPLYQKDKVLFGLNAAKAKAAKRGHMYVVEGYNDVISMHRGGAENTVATCGTALSQAQVEAIKKVCRKVVILRDSDGPGQKAAERDFMLCMQQGMEVDVCVLPLDQDPDDFVRSVMPAHQHYSAKPALAEVK